MVGVDGSGCIDDGSSFILVIIVYGRGRDTGGRYCVIGGLGGGDQGSKGQSYYCL